MSTAMQTDVLEVFEGVPIPADYASVQKYAVLARSGGGKTYLTAKMLEQMSDAGLFFVVLDPVGKHWSLRVGPDGSADGGKADVVVLGGLHGDAPLNAEDGALIADVVVDHPGRYILDVSTFETDEEQDRFAEAFARRFFRAKVAHPFAMLLVLEEAEAFVPERPAAGQGQMVQAFSRIQKMGRNHGIGMWLVSQRPQDISKRVLNQTEVLVVKQLAAKLEREAVDAWVKSNGTQEQRDEMMGRIGSFGVRDAYVWSPTWLRVFEQTIVLPRVTFDSSASARHGDALVEAELKPLDVGALAEQLQEAREKAASEDPAALRENIEALSTNHKRALNEAIALRQGLWECARIAGADISGDEGGPHGMLSEGPGGLIDWATREIRELRETSDEEPVRVERVEVPALPEEEVATMKAALDELKLASSEIAGTVGELANALDMAMEFQRATAEPLEPRSAAAFAQAIREPQAARTGHSTSAAGVMPRAALELAEVLAAFTAGLPTERLALFAGRKPRGGSWNTAMKALKDAGWINPDAPTGVAPTAALLERFPDARQPFGSELVAAWRPKMSGPAGQMLDALLEAHPTRLPAAELGRRTGRAPRGGSWNTAVKELKTAGLVDVNANGLKALDELVQ